MVFAPPAVAVLGILPRVRLRQLVVDFLLELSLFPPKPAACVTVTESN
jgi:hypothetical protein